MTKNETFRWGLEMQRKCLKCGALNADAAGLVTDACPSCGAIYSKVEGSFAPKAPTSSAPTPARGERIDYRRYIVAAAISIVLGAGGYYAYLRHLSAERIRAAELELAGAEANRATFESELKVFAELVRRWNDSLQLVSRTSRIALAGPMSTLQSINHEMQVAKFSSCLSESQAPMLEAINLFYADMLRFMGDSTAKITDDTLISEKQQESVNKKIECDAHTQYPVDAAKRKLAEAQSAR